MSAFSLAWVFYGFKQHLTRSSSKWTTSSSLFSASAFSISSLVRSDRFSGSLWAALTRAATWSSMLNPSSPSCSSSGKSSWLIGSYPCPSSPASSTSSDSSPESGSNTLKIKHVYDTVASSEFYLRCLWWGHRGFAPVRVRHIVQPWHLFHLDAAGTPSFESSYNTHSVN